uniref:Uncharacterized protein n=1 Tax=Aegilops tauschii subsp. strangulata TaxID=200361 RepID=A0A453H116_AEGTS
MGRLVSFLISIRAISLVSKFDRGLVSGSLPFVGLVIQDGEVSFELEATQSSCGGAFSNLGLSLPGEGFA